MKARAIMSLMMLVGISTFAAAERKQKVHKTHQDRPRTEHKVTNINILFPNGDTDLMLGTVVTIEWEGSKNVPYRILLEDEEGLGAGTVANDISSTQFEWKVGEVSMTTDQGMRPRTITPGKYRILIINTNDSYQSGKSNLFTVAS